MPKIKGEDLSSLYPYPKSFDEIEAERKLRELKRRPRIISIKIGIWTTLSVVILLAAYQTCSHLIVSGLSSAGTVIFGVFTSMLIGLAAVAAVFYLYSLINHLVTRVLTYPRVLSVILACIAIGICLALTTLIQQKHDTLLMILLVLVFNFALTSLAVEFRVRQENSR